MSKRINKIPKRDFLGKPAPAGYVAGVGRGATGFTTRSDLGPAREPSRHFSSQAGHSRDVAPRDDPDEEGEYMNEANYDEFAGYKGSLFNKEDPYDEDDKEADKIYENFDLHMNERGKALERKQALQLAMGNRKRPKIQQQFTDLTEDLKLVTEAEWMNLPESGDARNRKQRVGKIDKYTPIPESLLVEQNRLASGGETLVSIDPRTANHPDMETHLDDDDNEDLESMRNRLLTLANTDKNKPSGSSNQLVNIGDMNECRSTIISTTLSQASKFVKGSNIQLTDREAYLGQLASAGQLKVEDNLEERRKQYQMMLKTSDKEIKTKVYQMYIELEERAGKLSNARLLAKKGCEECPNSVDLWSEAIRLHPPEKAKQIMIDAIRSKPTSLRLWLKAAELETSDENKLRIYEKASAVIPTQPEIWRRWAEAGGEAKRELILEEAVKNCPHVIDLWIALARLKVPDMDAASDILSRASDENPAERSIQIELAKLYEKVNDLDSVKDIIADLVDDFKGRGLDIDRDNWLQDAISAEHDGYPNTAGAIVRRLFGWDLGHLERDPSKLVNYLLEDANKFANKNAPSCARQMYRCIVNSFKSKSLPQLRESAWVAWAKFEEKSGDTKGLESVLLDATSSPDYCQSSETLWLMLIDLKQKQGLIGDDAMKIVKEALEKNPKSEKIVLAAVELNCAKGSTKDARKILADACMVTGESANLLKRHAELERSLGNLDEAVRLLKIGVSKYRENPEFYLSLGTIEEQRGNDTEAGNYYKMGLTSNKQSIILWIRLARLYERTKNIPMARSTLTNARRFNDKNVKLYVESGQLEIRVFLNSMKGNNLGLKSKKPDLAESLISEGIRKCKGQPEFEILESIQKLFKERKYNQCV